MTEELAEGLKWGHIYFIRGTVPRHARHNNAISDPPSSGWDMAFILEGEKRSTIFSPYTFQAYVVPNTCMEIVSFKESRETFRRDYMRDMIERKWAQFQGWGFQKDYDTCARVLRRLGWEVPAQILTGSAQLHLEHVASTASQEHHGHERALGLGPHHALEIRHARHGHSPHFQDQLP